MRLAHTLAAIAFAVCSYAAAAAVPAKLTYQGFLATSAGQPVNGAVDMTVKLYNASTGGSVVWTDTMSVDVVNGSYTVTLGSTLNPIDASIVSGPLFLAVAIGADPEMTPRRELTSAPYAIRAGAFDGSIDASQFSGTIATAQIADGAVTAAKLAGNGCGAGQLLKFIANAWTCANDNDTNSGGTLTNVTASSPLASSGGATPNISFAGTLTVPNGGTGATTLGQGNLLYGQASGAIAALPNAAAGSVLMAGATPTDPPVWNGTVNITGGNLSLLGAASTVNVGGIQVIAAQQAAVADAANATGVDVAAASGTQVVTVAEYNALVAQFNTLLARLRTHGLIAP